GLTDPGKTGPLGRSAVVAAEGVKRARAIPRESPEAEKALKSIMPERVFAALSNLLAPAAGAAPPPATCASASGNADAPARHGGIAANAAVVAFMTLVSRAGGLVREMLMAHFFGAGVMKSAFDVAYRLPNLFRRLFGEGALSAALIPVYAEVAENDGRDEANKVASAVAGVTVAILGALSALGVLASFAVVRHFSIGERWLEVMPLLRIMLPYAPLICLAALVMGVLNSLKSFAVPALAPAFQNLCCIIALACVCPFLPDDGALRIRVVSWSILVSGAVQVAVQLPVLRRHGVPLSLAVPRPLPPGVRRVFRLMAPMALSAGLVQLNVFLDSLLAMKAGEWGPSALGYADRIVYLPLAIFGTAFYTALLPALSASVAVRDDSGFSASFARILRGAILVLAPASLGLVALAAPVTSLIYKSGAFEDQATARTSLALVAYSAGLVQAGVHKLALAPFFALKDSMTPMVVGAAGVALNLAMNLFFIWMLPVEVKPIGIAVATAISSTLAAGV
ncbi:MAG: murein biosynthesis integral membrane protein MurJ, partial [Kiritimatiellae bacterium]|nr:murein biosynthesis integral membrane protein MurJ [Kiritimatiellia bacterium]